MCIQCSSKQYLFHPSIHHRFQINSTQVVIELIIHDSNNHLVYYSNNYYLFSSSSAVRRSQLDEPSQNAMEGFVIPNQPAVGLVGFYVIHCDKGIYYYAENNTAIVYSAVTFHHRYLENSRCNSLSSHKRDRAHFPRMSYFDWRTFKFNFR